MLRRLLLAATLGWVSCTSPIRLPESSLLFPLGVASGAPAPDSIQLWTRYQGSRGLRYEIWPQGAEGLETSSRGEVTVLPGGFAQLEVRGLAPASDYSYGFFEEGEGGSRSRVGRFRTAPAVGDSPPVRFSIFSCAKNGNPMELMERAAESTVDAALFLGDTVYADSARDLEGYRAKWTENLSTLGFRSVRGSTPILATWDDHEVVNNWSGTLPSSVKQSAGMQAFFDFVPMRRDPLVPQRLWHSVRFGRTAEVFVLDSRAEREPTGRETATAQYLSAAQLQWLVDGLSASEARFKVVMNSVPITDFPGLFDAAADDRWEGYAAQRTHLLSEIETRGIPGVIFVAGDFHLGSVGKVAPSGPGASLMEVVVGPASNFTNPLAGLLGPPQFDWAKDVNNYALLDLDPETGEATVTFRDQRGLILFQRVYSP